MSFYFPPGAQNSEFIGVLVERKYIIRSWIAASQFGAVGNVWTAVNREDGHIYIVKTAKYIKSLECWKKEIRGNGFAQELNHANIMKVFDIGEQSCPLQCVDGSGRTVGDPGLSLSYAVIEYCLEMDLFSFLENGQFSKALAKHYFLELAHGIDAMHQKHGAHRDLKPENLLLSRYLTLKIGDFGFARIVGAASLFTPQTGTLQYSSPEAQVDSVRSADLDPKAQDIWMMGVCLFVLLTGSMPFECQHNIKRPEVFALLDSSDGTSVPSHRRYWNGKVPLSCGFTPANLRSNYLDDDICDLLNRMWDKNWENRITIDQVLKHRWLRQNEDGSVYVPYDMKEAVITACQRGRPESGSLLHEMCQKQGHGVLLSVLKEINALHQHCPHD